MHPLLECLPGIKAQLLKNNNEGVACDIFPGGGDLETYASTGFDSVLAIIDNVNDLKTMKERTPTRPQVRVMALAVHTRIGRCYIRTCLTSCNVNTLWVYMNRFPFSLESFGNLMSVMYSLLSDDANLFLWCIDKNLALQYARSRLLYIDKNNNILLHYERQPLDNIIDVDEIKRCCIHHGFIHEHTFRGDEILRNMSKNALPYDIWSSQIFFLLQFKPRPHFLNLM